MTESGVAETLAGPGPFTLFAVPDDAFMSMPSGALADVSTPDGKARLASIMRHCILFGLSRADALATLSTPMTLSGQRTSINVTGGKIAVGRARILRTFVGSTNGVIHVADAVNFPPTQDLLKALSEHGSFKVFASLVRGSDLASMIQVMDLTMFAPTDAAFAALPTAELAKLRDPSNTALRTTLVKRHLATGRVFTLAALDRGTLIDASGAAMVITGDREHILARGVRIRIPDLVATNGVVQGIDAVLPEPPLSNAGK